MDSDSELHLTDTLRCDTDSEDDNQLNKSESDTKNIPDGESVSHDTEIVQQCKEDAAEKGNKDSSDEQDMPSNRANIRRSKYSNIIDSESDEGEMATEINTNNEATHPNEAQLDRLKSLLDSDSDEQDDGELKKQPKKQVKRKPKPTSNKMGALSESDNEDSDETKPVLNEKVKRKPKKGTKTEESPSKVRTAKDILASLNLFFDDDDEEVAPRTNSGKFASASSEDESNEGLVRSTRPTRKMTTKEAMEDRQIIQSESQRMAREKYIDVPYHRTKVFSFEEFRARKTICKPNPMRDCTGSPMSSNMSIRMTTEQLEEFARKLEERELESQAFFKSESESSEAEPETDAATEEKRDDQQEIVTAESLDTKVRGEIEQSYGDACTVEPVDDQSSSGIIPPGTDTAKTLSDEQMDAIDGAAKAFSKDQTDPTDTSKTLSEELMDPVDDTVKALNEGQMDPIDDIVNRTSDNMEQMIASFQEAEKQIPALQTERIVINYDAFLPDLRSTTISAKKAALLANVNLPPCPKLSGNSDMVIDLDNGTIQPKAPSGVDILFQRLAKCSGTVRNASPSSTNTISILSTENGCVKLDTVSLFAKEDRPLVHKEPVPGAAFMKLKQVLKEKIDDNRRELIRKREAEFAKNNDLEKDEQSDSMEEEDEELLEDEPEDQMETDEETMSYAAGQRKQLLDDQALDENMSESEVGGSSSEDEEDEDNDEEQDIDKGGNKMGRIIKAFEDSDDDVDEEQSNRIERQTHPPSTDDHNVSTGRCNEDDEQKEDNLSLLWKDDADPSNQREDVEENDLLALCSGQFATQLPTQNHPSLSQDTSPSGVDLSQSNAEPLYTQNQEPFRESQLMELCSGRFETQAAQGVTQPTKDIAELPSHSNEQQDSVLDDSDICVGGRLRLDSSDDEAQRPETEPTSKSKKHKRKHLNISDDEDEVADGKPADDLDNADDHQSDEDDEAEEVERYVDYDSEENEVEVRLTKKEKELMSAKFVENEAELSESEWGSADEDEKDLDRYDVEMGDEEQYDQEQLQQELEKIHNRRMLDQDDRELEHLKEIFLEDEERDGVGRVRQFRWKNVEKTFSLDYDTAAAQDADGEANGSDEETELNWRKMRHERNLLLKENNIDLSSVDLTATSLLNPVDTTCVTDEQENLQTGSTPCGKKKITIVRKSNNPSTMAVKEDNPFLISNSTILQGHKASFLSRDQETLKKLASLIPESEGTTSTVLTAKARNFVFATLSPAVDKSSKRSLDPEDVEINANTKKKKTSDKEIGSKKKMLNSLL
ncbi:claspin-like [Anopheles funestus]|uniref:claspin-like n=1 Tax=Anopheles funestus TaxID=62324 RepID=UPI0020C60C73|nr:claspin-like [Anopheles funestus]